MGKKRSFEEISIGNQKNSMQEMKQSYEHIQENAIMIIDSVLQKSKEEEKGIARQVQKINRLIVDLKENQHTLIDAHAKIENAVSEEEKQEAILSYNQILEPYENRFAKINRTEDSQVIMDLSKLFPGINNEEKENSVSTFKDLMAEFKEFREELKHKRNGMRREREAVLQSFANEIVEGKFEKEKVIQYLQETFHQFGDEVKKEFQLYELQKDITVLMALKQMTDVFGYKPENITPEFFDVEKDNVIKEVEKAMTKADKIKQKLSELTSKNDKSTNTLLIGLRHKPKLAAKFILQEEKIKDKNNKYEFFKQLHGYIQREKNFKDNLQKTIYI